MAEVRKSSATDSTRGVVYDLVKRQRVAAPELAEPADSAGITERARELNRAREAVQGTPEVRTERVRALKHQVQNGTYQPDPRDVAREILERGF